MFEHGRQLTDQGIAVRKSTSASPSSLPVPSWRVLLAVSLALPWARWYVFPGDLACTICVLPLVVHPFLRTAQPCVVIS